MRCARGACTFRGGPEGRARGPVSGAGARQHVSDLEIRMAALAGGVRGRVGRTVLGVALGVTLVATGCARGPQVVPPGDRHPIDRSRVEYQGGFDLHRYITGLTAPTALATDP